MADVDVKTGVKIIAARVEEAFKKRPQTIKTAQPILVAVSKTKPAEMIVDAYSMGQHHFGENYVQEIIDKGYNSNLLEHCKDIKWHYIGHLQRNKINKMIYLPGLYMIETVDSDKLASSLDAAWAKIERPNKEKLKVLVQVNTSAETEKNGVEPSEVIALYRYIREKCSNLKIEGLMTIGKFGHDYTTGPNPDFISLMKCHADVCREFNLEPNEVQVSMGMSDDFEKAIEMGSTIVRVGSSIFGHRSKKGEV